MSRQNELLENLFSELGSFKKMPPEFFQHLQDAMQEQKKYYPEAEVLFDQDDLVKNAYYVARGTVYAYRIENGEKRVLYIYKQHDIIAGNAFMHQKESLYYLKTCSDSFLYWITYDQMAEVYTKFPEAEELAKLIVSNREDREVTWKTMLNQKATATVKDFYTLYPELLKRQKGLTDPDIATFLHLAEGTLRGLRNKLLKGAILKLPAKKAP